VAKKGLGIELGTIAMSAFGLFLWIAIFSYHSQDSSFFTESTEPVLNACGMVGAYLSSLFLQFFGFGAFLAPVGFLFVASHLHSKESTARALSSLAGVSVSVIALTIFVSLHWHQWHWDQGQFLTGGVFGAWLSVPMERLLNKTGASILSLAIFFSALVVSTPIGVANFLSKFIHASGVVAYRFGRLALTYLAYYSAILLNRLAQFIGVQAKKSFDNIRERAEAYRLARLEAKNAIAHEVTTTEITIARGETESAIIQEAAGASASDEEDSIDEAPRKRVTKKAERVEDEDSVMSAGEEPKKSVISVSELKKQKDFFEEGPVIEKVVSDSEGAKPKFKFEKKRGKWKLPIIDFLRKPARVETAVDREGLTLRAKVLTDKFAEFGIDGEVTAMKVGPVITLFEFKPGPGIKVSKIAGFVDDISMAMQSKGLRILAPLPGKNVVGIEIPSDHREQVLLREFLQTGEFQNPKYQLPIVMGKDIGGVSIYADLAKMPHLLVSGTTGSGKSVFMNGLITSLLYRFTPDELRLILVDPKFIEFAVFHDIPHLLLPVVDDTKNAASALKWAVREMERRYRVLEAAGAKNLHSYNELVEVNGAESMAESLQAEAQAQQESGELISGGDWIEAFEKDESGNPIIGKLPYIVIIIDELADLMMTVKKDVEGQIARIAQKARASGIHLVLATQRPSTDVVTGIVKANMPTRISFSLRSQIDSRTILDCGGAERLLGQGDMLFIPPGQNEPVRLQGAYLEEKELAQVTDFLREQGKPKYRNEILIDPEEAAMSDEGGGEKVDPLFEEALYIIRTTRNASASYLQRKLEIGYNRAARIIEMMEEKGMVGPADGSKSREVLIP
jgi:S-DNA-T family DNA segregation ATPase FtsK/SpoIIIE